MPSPRAKNKSGTSSSMGINNTTLRPAETPKDLKKRVNALNKSLASVHDRLIQTEKQIFDLERSYLEETRLYGNVLQGWDAYLESKGKGKGGDSLGIKRTRKDVVDTYVGADDAGELNAKRAKGVELQERLFSLGSVTSPAAKGIHKQEDKRRTSGRQGDAGGSGAGSSSSVAGSSSPKKSPKSAKVLKTPKDKKTFTLVLIDPSTRLPKSCASTVQINHEHQERVVRTVRQEPAKGNRLCVVHVHRDGCGGIHLCLRGRRQEWWGWERVTGVRSRVDGPPADWPLRGGLSRDAKVPNFSRGRLFPGRGDYHVPDHAGAVRGVRRPRLHDERQQREARGPRLRRFLLLPVCRVHIVCRYVGCLP